MTAAVTGGRPGETRSTGPGDVRAGRRTLACWECEPGAVGPAGRDLGERRLPEDRGSRHADGGRVVPELGWAVPHGEERAERSAGGEVRTGGDLAAVAADLERLLGELRPEAAPVRALLGEALVLCRRGAGERLPREWARVPPRAGGPRRLTARERQVVRLAAEGKSNGAIAALLGIGVRTVETHRTKAMQKLGLESLVELVRYAVRQKLVEP